VQDTVRNQGIYLETSNNLNADTVSDCFKIYILPGVNLASKILEEICK